MVDEVQNFQLNSALHGDGVNEIPRDVKEMRQ